MGAGIKKHALLHVKEGNLLTKHSLLHVKEGNLLTEHSLLHVKEGNLLTERSLLHVKVSVYRGFEQYRPICHQNKHNKTMASRFLPRSISTVHRALKSTKLKHENTTDPADKAFPDSMKTQMVAMLTGRQLQSCNTVRFGGCPYQWLDG